MAYDFKRLVDVSENTPVPEDGKVIYEKDGIIYRGTVEQATKKEIKNVTLLLGIDSSGEAESIYTEDAAGIFPVFLDGNEIPYVVKKSDLDAGKYTKLDTADLVELYQQGVEIRMYTAVVSTDNSVPTYLSGYDSKALNGYTPLNTIPCVYFGGKHTGSGLEFNDTNEMFVFQGFSLPCLTANNTQPSASSYTADTLFLQK